MDGNTLLINDLRSGRIMNPDENVFEHIWKEYERVIMESLITSFGLDFIVKDSVGGDVDTINNVRNLRDFDGYPIIRNDKLDLLYQNRGEYDSQYYHGEESLWEQ